MLMCVFACAHVQACAHIYPSIVRVQLLQISVQISLYGEVQLALFFWLITLYMYVCMYHLSIYIYLSLSLSLSSIHPFSLYLSIHSIFILLNLLTPSYPGTGLFWFCFCCLFTFFSHIGRLCFFTTRGSLAKGGGPLSTFLLLNLNHNCVPCDRWYCMGEQRNG